MKHIQLFEDFVNEQAKDTFNSHKNHNPAADILQRQLDRDTMITYGIYVKDLGSKKKGDEFMEIYIGSNYVPDSTKRSHSKYYTSDQIPSKYKSVWDELKSKYENELKESSLTEATSIKDHMTKAAEYKKQLMDLKKGAKGAKDPQAHAARVAAKEEQLRRVADVIRNLRAEGVKEDASELTEAKDLRQLQRALDKLQNDYEEVLDDDALDALTQLITAVNLKLK